MDQRISDPVYLVNFSNEKMTAGYQIQNQECIHLITFAVVEWVDVFT